VWNRTGEKARAWAAEHGALACETPAEAAAEADVVVSMVVDGPQVQGVLLGGQGEEAPDRLSAGKAAATGAAAGTLFIDCSTIGPAWARLIGGQLAERGMRLLDAPVTGSAPRAQDGTLTIMAGGSERDFADARPALEAMGRLIVHAGELGQGQTVKLINNAVAATNAAVLAEALIAAKAAGADLEAVVEVMGAGSAASAMLELKAQPMREHDYSTLFKLEHMLKDVRLCLERAGACGAPMPFAALTGEILSAARGRGLGEADFAALLEVLEGAAGTRL
jgi:3-hydroxyisobutyrate dehydrogenase-like beta-hydroxyacid dehydrogenase